MGLCDGHHVLELFEMSRSERERKSLRDTEENLPRDFTELLLYLGASSVRAAWLGGRAQSPGGATYDMAVCPAGKSDS